MPEIRWQSILLALLLVALMASTSSAATLSDPTRPPDGYGKATAQGKSVKKRQKGWKLQSILTGEGREVAVIDGVAVARGDRYGSARLTRIESGQVTLRTRNGRKIILKLTPGIHKKDSENREMTSR